MVQIKIKAYIDCINGFLLNCFKKGIIEIPKEDLEDFKEDPVYYLNQNNNKFCDDLDLDINDSIFELEHMGEIEDVDYQILEVKDD